MLQRHENSGVAIKVACGLETFMLDVTFIKTMEKREVLGKRKRTRKGVVGEERGEGSSVHGCRTQGRKEERKEEKEGVL